MKTRSTDSEASNIPSCWQREAPVACLRVELPTGETHLFSYQHFVTASHKRGGAGIEILNLSFSTHEVELEGRGLRELLLGLQDFGVKWLRTAPERYLNLQSSNEGFISSIRVSAIE